MVDNVQLGTGKPADLGLEDGRRVDEGWKGGEGLNDRWRRLEGGVQDGWKSSCSGLLHPAAPTTLPQSVKTLLVCLCVSVCLCVCVLSVCECISVWVCKNPTQ